ncbi:MAG: hypothetical protein E5Y74_16365 [Mesorhizobium sp.]|uniref:hypothetical protein n=1 Tax=unclassified Mesorhizobium TaxID=325217 RepID=UPI000FCB39B9|nr:MULTISPECIES: hypothetical protein [unclassified Mesorhizobium]RVD18926.1 hypothetical protein EN749_03115 [Mesorhizobium sp. M7A.F.Ca.ET.027.02.1.1]RVD66477.1 hypothetical protein EN750_03220 [Mesorhizobium sp. M7A.F.Ca.ET.027.03.2.1]RWD11228.1 MAG: hypothetical protein EOS73_06155 [Mesorhizobium sp.]RWQ24255.1 MAG: hypothetical protein EOR93_04955 [Mesorhizobium sp.]TIM20877.1 MAG: hypothetical protein E5Y74_16365 [Mesorhizobium sp.]
MAKKSAAASAYSSLDHPEYSENLRLSPECERPAGWCLANCLFGADWFAGDGIGFFVPQLGFALLRAPDPGQSVASQDEHQNGPPALFLADCLLTEVWLGRGFEFSVWRLGLGLLGGA